MMNNWQFLEERVTPYKESFLQELQNPLGVQWHLLQEILRTNKETVFGRKYGFESIGNYREFCQRVPIHSYEALHPYIQRIAAGEAGVLSADPVVAFEVTGGSSGGAKLIPYTSKGLAGFRQAIFPWLADLLQQRPRIKLGKSYWAISPVRSAKALTTNRVNIGMSDAAYFGEELAKTIASLLAVPPEFAEISNVAEWRYKTALFLLATADLTLISVWSPTFLLQLLEEIKNQADRMIRDIANPQRAKLLSTAISGDNIDTQAIWPHLDTISCWTDAAANAFIPQLQASFPHVWIQGKGLLATEGAVTLPLVGCVAPVLAIKSGFYEFLDAENKPHLCHQLADDRVYRVVITTPSGFYRYDLGDRVRVRGWFGQTPLLEFIGRAGLVSDLCGEKLTEDFVLTHLPMRSGFAMLAPSLSGKPHYVLFLDGAEYDEEGAIGLSRQCDRALAENPQYQYARELGQLGELVARRVENPMARYIQHALERGQRLGDIKPPALRPETDWEEKFRFL